MRMHYVVEDYEALARWLEAGMPWKGNEIAPGKLIACLRRGLQISQLHLAQRAGVPRSLLARVEAGGDAKLSSLQKLFEALGCGWILLPISEPLAREFKAKAKAERRSRRECQRARRRLGLPPLDFNNLGLQALERFKFRG